MIRMSQKKWTKPQLLQEIENLKTQLAESEETLEAIRKGEVDALVISAEQGPQIYTLQSAERPYRLLVEAMQEGAVILSDKSLILYSNRRFAELIKSPLEKVLGTPIVSYIAAEQQATLLALLHQGQNMSSRGEVTLSACDGTLIPAYVTFSVLPTQHPSEICVVIRDLTEQKKMEETSHRLIREQAARVEAEAANVLKMKFLAMISHELRTPLASIKGFATTLLATDVIFDDDTQHEFIGIIDEEADKLSNLVEQLLDLSRLQAGTFAILPKPESLEAITQATMPQLQTLTKIHHLIIDVPQNLPHVMVDKQRITQVIVNLVGNAAKFSPLETQIMLTVTHQADMIQVDVADEGPGIRPENRALVFEAFQQVDQRTPQEGKGAGLGLAICKGIIEAHHGQIWIQPKSDPGTTISFTLPILPSDSHSD